MRGQLTVVSSVGVPAGAHGNTLEGVVAANVCEGSKRHGHSKVGLRTHGNDK